MELRIGIFATIVDDAGRVLLVHRRDHDFWCQPGGGLELEEAPWEGVIREAREETGLTVVITRLAGVYSDPPNGNLIFAFTCAVTGGALTLNDEADNLDYFAPDALPANTFAEHVRRIRDALGASEAALLSAPTHPTATEEVRLRMYGR